MLVELEDIKATLVGPNGPVELQVAHNKTGTATKFVFPVPDRKDGAGEYTFACELRGEDRKAPQVSESVIEINQFAI